MKQHLNNFENWLNTQFKKLPALPKGGRDFLVDAAPWLSLIGAFLSIWAIWTIWEWARKVDRLNDYTEAWLGVSAVSDSRWTFGVWLLLVVLIVLAVFYLMAFSQLKDRKKAGWDLIFYALLLNLAYGTVLALTNYGDFGSFLSSLAASAVGLYFLFQIRGAYAAEKKPGTKKAAPTK